MDRKAVALCVALAAVLGVAIPLAVNARDLGRPPLNLNAIVAAAPVAAPAEAETDDGSDVALLMELAASSSEDEALEAEEDVAEMEPEGAALEASLEPSDDAEASAADSPADMAEDAEPEPTSAVHPEEP